MIVRGLEWFKTSPRRSPVGRLPIGLVGASAVGGVNGFLALPCAAGAFEWAPMRRYRGYTETAGDGKQLDCPMVTQTEP
jgi:hypothetical protein